MKKPFNRLLFIPLILAMGSIALCKRAFRKHNDDKKDSIQIMVQTASNMDIEDKKRPALKNNREDTYSFKFHKIMLVVPMLIVWGGALGAYGYGIYGKVSFFAIALSLGVFVVITWVSAFYTYSQFSIIRMTSRIAKNLKTIIQLVLFIASPSWWFANLFKARLKEPIKDNDEDRADIDKLTAFIANNNRVNLAVSVVILVLVAFIPLNNWWTGLLMTIVVLRTLSRSFEITLAFGDDAIDHKKKTSDLLHNERLMLAFSSLIECIINYTVAYYMIGQSARDMICKWQAFVHSFQSALFYSNDLLSSSLYSNNPTALAMLQVTQVITCMTLVFIAFVIYISKTTEDKNTTTRRV